MIEFDTICMEGIDKTCKDLVMHIVCDLSKFKYMFTSRRFTFNDGLF